MAKQPMRTRYSKQTMLRLLAERIREMNADYEAAHAEWEKAEKVRRKKFAAWMKGQAEKIRTGELACPIRYFRMEIPEELMGEDEPRKPYCHAATILQQVRNSDQQEWQLTTDRYVEIFGAAPCEV